MAQIRPTEIAQSKLWDNIGRDAGISLINEGLKNLSHDATKNKVKGTAQVYTWMVMAAWEPKCRNFGKLPRVKAFEQFVRANPSVIRFIKLDDPVELHLMGHVIDLRSVVGVSTLLPVNIQWSKEFVAGRNSLYDLSPTHLSKPNRNTGLYYGDSTDVVANAMVNLFALSKYLTMPAPHNGREYLLKYPHQKDRATKDIFASIYTMFLHLSEFLGPLQCPLNGDPIYRTIEDRKEIGRIPRVLTPQTGVGMFDDTLPDYGFEDFGKNMDKDNLFICNLNFARPSDEIRSLAKSIGRIQ